MIFNRKSAAIKDQARMSWREKQQIQVENNCEQEDGGEGIYDMFWTMWMGVPRHTKYKSNPGHKTVYNSDMPYFIALMMTGPEFSEDPENEQINPWPERNPMTLDKMMMNVWNKWVIDLGRKEGQWDKDVAERTTKFEAQKVSMRLSEPYLRSTR